ncbi:HTH_Tnp_Tc3_2 domain-containing protein [Trichonephila clavipes]|nr:HTH_Tnp_Tc3_2 domain-containing protein [Trichonephila clavipes]
MCDLSTGTARPYIPKQHRQDVFSAMHNLSHPGKRSVCIHPGLLEATHVFLRRDMLRRPLQQPYDGPFKVLQRKDKVFSLTSMNETPATVKPNATASTPATVESDPTASTPTQPSTRSGRKVHLPTRNCWEQWTREGTQARKTGSGATRKTTRREDRRIVRQALVDPTVTRSTIRADVGVAIVPQTISRHLAEANLKSKRLFRALPLTPEHRQLRLQWC